MKNWLKYFIFILIVFVAIVLFKNNDHIDKSKAEISIYPDGKNFAFTITDDPDGNTLEKIKPVYDYLNQFGIKTTPAVWVSKPKRTNGIPDLSLDKHPKKRSRWSRDTCERKEYLDYMKHLQKEGFEIALHGASTGNDKREETIKGYEKFFNHFGYYPKINIMHAQNLENVYWGKKIISNPLIQSIIGMLSSRADIPFSGEDKTSDYFWGDILQENTKYVRMFGTSDINTLKFNPTMPYHDNKKPYVNYWFSFSDGSKPEIFSKLLSQENLSRLAKERGVCIVYTHLAHGFYNNGKLDNNFIEGINNLISEPDGWFVPCSDILDRLQLFKKVFLMENEKYVMIVNLNDENIDGTTIVVSDNSTYYGLDEKKYIPNKEGEIIIDNIEGRKGIVLCKNKEKKEDYKIIHFDDAVFIYRSDFMKKVKINKKIIGDSQLFDANGNKIKINELENIVLDNQYQKIDMVLLKNLSFLNKNRDSLSYYEKINLFVQRTWLYFKHNYN